MQDGRMKERMDRWRGIVGERIRICEAALSSAQLCASDRAAGQKGGEASTGGVAACQNRTDRRAGPCADNAGNVATRFAASVMGSAFCGSGNSVAGCLPQVVRIITTHSWEIASVIGLAIIFALLQKCGGAGSSKGLRASAVTWVIVFELLWFAR